MSQFTVDFVRARCREGPARGRSLVPATRSATYSRLPTPNRLDGGPQVFTGPLEHDQQHHSRGK